jgi:hypothetical protein
MVQILMDMDYMQIASYYYTSQGNDILKENYIRSIVLFGSSEYYNELYY